MLYIWWARPREGKTFAATERVLYLLPRKRAVFTNFPVINKMGHSPHIWEDPMIYKNIQDADIFIDESYCDWCSSETELLKDKNRMTFLHTTGHSGNNIHFIAQSPIRILKAIRDICSEYYLVKKFCVPWPLPWWKDAEGGNRPILFRILTYSVWKDEMSPDKDKADAVRYLWFSQNVATAYDTHQFRQDGKPFLSETWKEKFERERADRKEVEDLLTFS